MAGLQGALVRYRVMTYAVGIGLLVLVLVGIPFQVAGRPHIVQVVGPIHGFLYIVYLVSAADLTRRARWPIPQLAGPILGGLVPFLAFVVERRVTKRVQRQIAGLASGLDRHTWSSAGIWQELSPTPQQQWGQRVRPPTYSTGLLSHANNPPVVGQEWPVIRCISHLARGE